MPPHPPVQPWYTSARDLILPLDSPDSQRVEHRSCSAWEFLSRGRQEIQQKAGEDFGATRDGMSLWKIDQEQFAMLILGITISLQGVAPLSTNTSLTSILHTESPS